MLSAGLLVVGVGKSAIVLISLTWRKYSCVVLVNLVLCVTSEHHQCTPMFLLQQSVYKSITQTHSCRRRVNKHFMQPTQKKKQRQACVDEQRLRPNKTPQMAQTRLLQRISTGQTAPQKRLLRRPSPSKQPQPKPAPRHNGTQRQTHLRF